MSSSRLISNHLWNWCQKKEQIYLYDIVCLLPLDIQSKHFAEVFVSNLLIWYIESEVKYYDGITSSQNSFDWSQFISSWNKPPFCRKRQRAINNIVGWIVGRLPEQRQITSLGLVGLYEVWPRRLGKMCWKNKHHQTRVSGRSDYSARRSSYSCSQNGLVDREYIKKYHSLVRYCLMMTSKL